LELLNEPNYGEQSLTVGSNWDGNHFVGGVDEVAIFGHLLSPEEIEILYSAGRTGRGLKHVLDPGK
jgi:hypothetical protein